MILRTAIKESLWYGAHRRVCLVRLSDGGFGVRFMASRDRYGHIGSVTECYRSREAAETRFLDVA